MKFATKTFDTPRLTLDMLLHYQILYYQVVQKFWKSVTIWQSYSEFKGGNFFETQCTYSVSPQTNVIISKFNNIPKWLILE